MIYKIPITPMGAPRMSRKDKYPPFREVVERYHAFRDDVRMFSEMVGYVQGESLDIVFVLPMPTKSWSKKKRASFLGKPHKSKPDDDNMIKAWLDAHLVEDSHVWDEKALKFWGEEGGIYLNCYDIAKKCFQEKGMFTPDMLT